MPKVKIRLIEVPILVSKQTRYSSFNRMDLGTKILFIEQYYGKNSFGFDLYKKDMERALSNRTKKQKRALSDRAQKQKFLKSFAKKDICTYFKQLIESFSPEKILPLTINKHYQLCDGAHRLALCIYYGIEKVPFIMHKKKPVNYDYTKEAYRGFFSDKEIEMIDDKIRHFYE